MANELVRSNCNITGGAAITLSLHIYAHTRKRSLDSVIINNTDVHMKSWFIAVTTVTVHIVQDYHVIVTILFF